MEYKKLTIQPFHAQMLGPYSNHLQFTAKSDYIIDIWVVPSKKDAELVMESGSFNYDARMSKQRVTEHSTSGSVPSGTWIVLANRAHTSASIEIWIG
ncbi:MAG: hypothetical protein R6U44_04115 [Archaeoglobaceae archaeon]